MDLCGFPKTAFFLRQAMWIKDRPVLAIVPHWNWKGKEGKPIRVMVITNARQAELFLNGKSLGVKDVDPYAMVNWEVPYEPGTLEAVARTDGKEVARTKVETAGDPVALKLVPDRSALAGDGLDAMPVTVKAVDAKGRVVPGASPMVTFRIDGPLRLLGLGNGDPNCHEPEQGTSRSLFHGLGQAIVSSVSGGHGDAVLHASAPGLAEATVTIPVKPAQAPASLPPAPPVQIIPKWRVSSVTDTKPDPSAQLADNDMNSWTQVRPPRIEKATKPGWIAFRSDRFKPFEQQLKEGGVIRFHGLRGKGEVWVDGAKVLDKADPKVDVVEVPMPAGDREHQVVLLFQVGNDSKEAGLADVVTIEPLPKRAP
jgi:beta-galactosidase